MELEIRFKSSNPIAAIQEAEIYAGDLGIPVRVSFRDNASKFNVLPAGESNDC